MDDRQWLTDYLDRYRKSLFEVEVYKDLIQLKDLMKKVGSTGNKSIIVGNGGSSGIAGHCSIDFTKNAQVRCINFNEPSLITCLANDYGYKNWVKKALELYAALGDLVILISSSGSSPNIINAAHYAREQGLKTVTFTGFAPDNPLRAIGHLNFWVNSRAYNIVEMTHQIWLLAVCDLIIGKAEYPASEISWEDYEETVLDVHPQ